MAFLDGGAKCAICITYAPTKTGQESSRLTIGDSAFTDTQTVPLSGTVTAPIARVHRPRKLSTPGDQNHQRRSIRVPDQFWHQPTDLLGFGHPPDRRLAQTNNSRNRIGPEDQLHNQRERPILFTGCGLQGVKL